MNNIEKCLKKINLESIDSPVSIAFDVTERCNFRCRHCYNNSGDKVIEDMSDEKLLDVANQIAEIQPLSVCLCGGEPLIRGECIYKVIQILSKNCGTVNMVSNGWLITDEVSKRLKKCGLNGLQISLDGNNRFSHDNIRMMPGSFDRALGAIRNASDNELAVMASFCPNKMNYRFFEETAELVRKSGGIELRSMPLILMGRGRNMKELQLSPREYIEFQQIVKRTEKRYKYSNFRVEWGDPIDHLYRMPNNHEIGFNSFSMEIRADGKLIVSSYLPIVVGDLNEHTIKEYWRGGYNRIWENKNIKKYINNIYSTDQYSSFEPMAYTGRDIVVELL